MKYNKTAMFVMVSGIMISLISIMVLIIDNIFNKEGLLPLFILSIGLPLWFGGHLFGGAGQDKGKEKLE